MAGKDVSALTDVHGRPLHDLRISVMDRCNFRCPYCMPEATYHEHFRFLEPKERLSFDEIERVARVAVSLGVRKLRLTGGEPLLRPKLPELVARLASIDGVEDIALTTNGVLLERHVAELKAAGLNRVTVSLDSLDPAVFARMSGGRAQLDPVLEAIDSAAAEGFSGGVKLNTVIQRGLNDEGVESLAERFRHSGVVLRFIEYMDVGTRNHWERAEVVPSRELLERLETLWPLEPVDAQYRGEVARRYRYCDGGGEVGFISSVTAPFCGDCSRARLSSEGQLYTCLFASEGTDLRTLLRSSDDDAALRALLAEVWRQRTDRYSEERAASSDAPARRRIEMNYIGG
ncbi:GTP 3',8-cyclase MoaA [Gluconobacter kanchanaburiensis]|uniref:GTP 3',8-cyclase n=1 Tax=Gluconobacter kanchanaburiensis NBRC 103587 TaxID=1307948 RepID=A0A511B9L0_9PROT|nr:GTP 3',8-cyclase MoaA [Gluconobacter kanchanaburiensis]MBF0862835.1 GTP 3',8-cyclase MoaA [Gluconobacter kanchanaburiensis]GBR70452.1 molybdenum cofactor biosynthesis protein A [Gluconobacter kanchanaburiensis NBRC 103587]GEK97118.1 cyclic pyranopterin monophosphate synthase [Gluconobacter kanchanaburiensis NBRC 103587]